MNKLIAKLALIGALIGFSIADAATIPEAEHTPHAAITARVTGETHDEDYAEGDVMLMPKVTAPVGDAEVRYNGVFRKTTNSEGETSDWATFVNKLTLSGDTWDFVLGRDSWRQFGGTTTTVGFDNFMSGKGLSRSFTGYDVTYKPWGLRLGVVASNGEIDWEDLDTGVISWSQEFADCVGVQIHMAATEDHLVEKAGLAIEWRPTDSLRILSDTVYGQATGTSSLLACNVQLTPAMKLFAGAEVNAPCDDSATGRAVLGAEGDLGHGFKVIGGLQQGILNESETTAILGFIYKGDYTLF